MLGCDSMWVMMYHDNHIEDDFLTIVCHSCRIVVLRYHHYRKAKYSDNVVSTGKRWLPP